MTWRGDLVVVTLCAAGVVASAAWWTPPGGAAHTALIETRGGERHALPLAIDTRVTVVGRRGATLIEVRDGRARILESACPRQHCVRAGWLKEAGEASACVPNGVSLRLIGDDPAYDAISF